MLKFDDLAFGAALSKKTDKAVPIVCQSHAGMVNGVHHHAWIAPNRNIPNYKLSDKMISEYYIVLPHFPHEHSIENVTQFTVIASDWTEIVPSESFCLSQLPSLQ